MIKILIILFTLFSFSILSKPAYYSSYERFRDAVFNNAHSVSAIKILHTGAVSAVFSAVLSDKEKYTMLAKIEFFMGCFYELGYEDNYKIIIDVTQFNPKKGYDKMKKSAEAITHFNKSVSYINTAMKNGEFADGLRIRSDASGQLCVLNGIFYLLTNGLKVLKDSERARKFDPTNTKMLLFYAATKAYPPAIYFGDTEKAIKILNQARNKKDLEKDDYYNMYLMYGLCYAKKKQNSNALLWLEKAIRIYPKNKIANELYRQVKLNIYIR